MARLAPTRTSLLTLALVLCISGAWFGRWGAQRRAEGDGTAWLSVLLVQEDSPVADSVAQPPQPHAVGPIPRMATVALVTRSSAADRSQDSWNLPARAALPGATDLRTTPLPPRGPPNV